MTQRMKVSFGLVLGAWAALMGWLALNLIGYKTMDAYVQAILTGGLVGLATGAAIAALEKYSSTAQARGTILGALIGTVTGFVSGTLGLLLGEVLFQNVPLTGDAKEIVRLIGWGIFGLGVGVGPGIATGSVLKSLWSSAGGCLGGLIGGGLFILLGLLFKTFTLTSSALSFTLVGLFAGLFIVFGQEMGKRAQLSITAQYIGTKPKEGEVFNIFKRVASIGSAKADWIIANDPSLRPHHVEIRLESGNFVLHSMIPTSPAMVGGQAVPMYVLNDGDRFRVGATEIAIKMRK